MELNGLYIRASKELHELQKRRSGVNMAWVDWHKGLKPKFELVVARACFLIQTEVWLKKESAGPSELQRRVFCHSLINKANAGRKGAHRCIGGHAGFIREHHIRGLYSLQNIGPFQPDGEIAQPLGLAVRFL